MRVQAWSAALVLVVWGLVPCDVSAQDKKKSDSEAPVIEIDPEGQPNGRNIDGPRYLLWRDGDVWHLRTHTEKAAVTFAGTVRVEEGTVTKITNFEGLEPRQRKGQKRPDVGRLSRDKKTIAYNFATKGRVDGFDFQVSKSATNIQFELKTAGYADRKFVYIGLNAQHPPEAVFSLPARAAE
jgi:hypothetical protein